VNDSVILIRIEVIRTFNLCKVPISIEKWSSL